MEKDVRMYEAIKAAYKANNEAAGVAHRLGDYERRERLYGAGNLMRREMDDLSRRIHSQATPEQWHAFRHDVLL